MKYYKLTILFSFIFILLTSNIASAAISEGDTYSFTILSSETYERELLNDVEPGALQEQKSEWELVIEITDINDKDEELSFDMIEGGWFFYSPRIDNNTASLNATQAGLNMFRMEARYFTKDSGSEYLSYVKISLSYDLFTNPDWADFNQGLIDALDDDVSVSYFYFYESNKTLSDVTDDASSFEIMGENNLADARDKLDSDKKFKYEFSFDFSDAVTYEYYDQKDEEIKYEDYSVYELSLTVEYDDNGVLSYAKSTTKKEVTTEYAVITSESITEITTGGLSGFIAGVPGFEFPLVMLAVSIPILIRKKIKK